MVLKINYLKKGGENMANVENLIGAVRGVFWSRWSDRPHADHIDGGRYQERLVEAGIPTVLIDALVLREGIKTPESVVSRKDLSTQVEKILSGIADHLNIPAELQTNLGITPVQE